MSDKKHTESDQVATDEVEQETQEQAELQAPDVGGLLRKKRTEMDLSINEVAERLNISKTHVAALEENRFEDLPNAVFCKGYLRNYAGLLGLDPEYLTASMDEHLDAKNIPSAASKQNKDYAKAKPLAVENAKRSNHFIFILIPVLLLVGAYVYYHFSEDASVSVIDSELNEMTVETEQSSAETVDELESIKVQDALDLSASNMLINQEEDAAAAVEFPSAVTESEASTASVTDAELTHSDVEAGEVTAENGQSGASSNTATSSLALNELGLETNSTAQTTSEQLDEEALVSNAQLDVLRIDYNKDSWTEVYDANNERLVYETKKKGERLQIEAQGPFYIKFGRPGSTTVYLNNNLVSIKTDLTHSPISFVLE